MIFWRAFAVGQRLLHDYVNRAAIFGVHADQAGMLRGWRIWREKSWHRRA